MLKMRAEKNIHSFYLPEMCVTCINMYLGSSPPVWSLSFHSLYTHFKYFLF